MEITIQMQLEVTEYMTEKKLILILDHVTGEVTWDNPDELNYFEVLGLMETAKMMMVLQEAESR